MPTSRLRFLVWLSDGVGMQVAVAGVHARASAPQSRTPLYWTVTVLRSDAADTVPLAHLATTHTVYVEPAFI